MALVRGWPGLSLPSMVCPERYISYRILSLVSSEIEEPGLVGLAAVGSRHLLGSWVLVERLGASHARPCSSWKVSEQKERPERTDRTRERQQSVGVRSWDMAEGSRSES